jgi:methionyl-tRNA formyltransferase
MRLAVIGRSEILLASARALRSRGHEIVLVITAKGAPEYAAQADDFERFANDVGAAFLRSAALTGAEVEIADASAEIGISYNYPTMLPKALLDSFPGGVLNAHGGDLPRYRGNACQVWAMLNGEERIGLCVHRMVPHALDAGDIIARDYFQIDLRTKVTAVHAWMTARVPTLFAEALELLRKDEDYVLEKQSDNPSDALRCYPRAPEDGQISWRSTAADIVRLVNASNKPYSGAFCDFNGQKVIVWDAEVVEDKEAFVAIPGQVTRLAAGGVEVATGNGKVRLLLVETDGHEHPPGELVKSLRQRFR